MLCDDLGSAGVGGVGLFLLISTENKNSMFLIPKIIHKIMNVPFFRAGFLSGANLSLRTVLLFGECELSELEPL